MDEREPCKDRIFSLLSAQNFMRPIYTVDEIEATWLYPFFLGMQDANEERIRCHAASSA